MKGVYCERWKQARDFTDRRSGVSADKMGRSIRGRSVEGERFNQGGSDQGPGGASDGMEAEAEDSGTTALRGPGKMEADSVCSLHVPGAPNRTWVPMRGKWVVQGGVRNDEIAPRMHNS